MNEQQKIIVQKINDVTVKPIKGFGQKDPRPIKGASLFNEIYGNIFLCARKRSGKTSVIAKIIKECTNKETSVVVFSSTLERDDIWNAMQDYCNRRGIAFVGYRSIYEDGCNQLENLLDHLGKSKEVIEENKEKVHLLDLCETEERKKEKMQKYRTPEYLIIFDDISNELKDKYVNKLLKENRHYKAKVIISSQYWNDLLPMSRKQVDYLLLFKGIQENKLEEIYKDIDLSIDYTTFSKLYHYATVERYNFFYIDIRNDELRRNFNSKFTLPSE